MSIGLNIDTSYLCRTESPVMGSVSTVKTFDQIWLGSKICLY